MVELLILKGLPASGKSTWAREFVNDKTDWVIVNRDSLRNMRGIYWLPKQEHLITLWEEGCVKSALESNYNVILDATNLNEKYLKKWYTKYENADNVVIKTKVFETTLAECLERDKNREASVGSDVILRMYNSYLK